MQKYYPVIILSTLFLALIIAQLIKQDFNRAGISALFMAITCGILFGLTFVTDTITAWILMAIFVIIIVLFSVARSDVLNIYTPSLPDITTCNKVSGSEESGSEEEKPVECVKPTPKPTPKPSNTNNSCIDPCDQCGECLTSCCCEEAFKNAPHNFYGTA